MRTVFCVLATLPRLAWGDSHFAVRCCSMLLLVGPPVLINEFDDSRPGSSLFEKGYIRTRDSNNVYRFKKSKVKIDI